MVTYLVLCRYCASVMFVTENWEVALDGVSWSCLAEGCGMAGPHVIDCEVAEVVG